MKNSLSSFGEFTLNRSEMKGIKGGDWASHCRYVCLWENSGGKSFEGYGWAGGLPSDNVGTRLPEAGKGTGLVCVIFECNYKQI